jgi:thymidylate synthase
MANVMLVAKNMEFDSIDEIQRQAFGLLLSSGLKTSPRGLATSEIIAPTFILRNPRRRFVTNPARRWSFPLAIGELCWHLSASDDVAFISQYAPRWREFSDDGSTIAGSCYGKRVFERKGGKPSQWDSLINLLTVDPQSRRAVLLFREAGTESLQSKRRDVACATSFQCLIREGHLHTVVYMRSNDAILGLPYDVFLFTMLQEILATTLGLELGYYYHMCGSLHLYDKNIELAKRVMSSAEEYDFEMPKMQSTSDIKNFLEAENSIRLGHPCDLKQISEYWRNLLFVIDNYFNERSPRGVFEKQRHKQRASEQEESVRYVGDPT